MPAWQGGDGRTAPASARQRGGVHVGQGDEAQAGQPAKRRRVQAGGAAATHDAHADRAADAHRSASATAAADAPIVIVAARPPTTAGSARR